MTHLHNYFGMFERIVPYSSRVANVVVVDREIAEISALLCMCKSFEPMWNKVKGQKFGNTCQNPTHFGGKVLLVEWLKINLLMKKYDKKLVDIDLVLRSLNTFLMKITKSF